MESQQKNFYPAVQKQVPGNAKQPGEYPIQDAPPPYASVVVQPQTAVIMVSDFFLCSYFSKFSTAVVRL